MHGGEHLAEVVMWLAVAVMVIAPFHRMGISPVIGYLAAGLAIGPSGLQLVNNTHAIEGVAEYGVIFLLFVIGLELSLERLRRMRGQVFGFGTAQVAVTSVAIGGMAYAMGLSPEAALVVGGGLALSSTAMVLQLVGEGSEKVSQVGRLSIAVLILQDLAVIPLLAVVPLLAGSHDSILHALSEAGLRAMIGLFLMVVAGRLLLRPLFRFIAARDHHELFTGTILLVVLGLSYASTLAGLSPALGAFMAGLLVAETEFRPQVEADILPYKNLLIGLFFITVGMKLDVALVLENLVCILGLTAALMGGKAVIFYVLSRLLRFRRGPALHSAALLSQGSEFAFVLFALAAQHDILSGPVTQVLLAVVSLSMALTAPFTALGKKAGAWLDCRHAEKTGGRSHHESLELRDHVIIAGYGRVGKAVGRLLAAENIPFVALDLDAETVGSRRAKGELVYYGDAARPLVLRAAGVANAAAFLITHNDLRTSIHTIRAVQELNRRLPIVARAYNLEQVLRLEASGAKIAVAEMFETSLQLGGALMRQVGLPEAEISRVIEAFRAEDYTMLRQAKGELESPA